MKLRKLVVVFIMLLITLCVLVIAKNMNDYFEFKERDRIALINISTELAVNADWEEVRHEIYCNRIPIGISLEEIKMQFENITPIEIARRHDFYPYYNLYFLDSNLNLRDMSLVFDREGKLVKKSVYAGFGETMNVECP